MSVFFGALNKPELFVFKADKIVSIDTVSSIVVTKDEDVVSNKAIDINLKAPCNHTEAENRMFLHAKHAALSGIKSVNITVSSDVVALSVAVFDELHVDQLKMTLGKGKDLQWIPIHFIVRS